MEGQLLIPRKISWFVRYRCGAHKTWAVFDSVKHIMDLGVIGIDNTHQYAIASESDMISWSISTSHLSIRRNSRRSVSRTYSGGSSFILSRGNSVFPVSSKGMIR